MTIFTDGWANIAGSTSTHVIINANGDYNQVTETIEMSGTIQNNGPNQANKYVIGGQGITTKYDWYFKNSFVKNGVTIYRFVKTIRD